MKFHLPGLIVSENDILYNNYYTLQNKGIQPEHSKGQRLRRLHSKFLMIGAAQDAC